MSDSVVVYLPVVRFVAAPGLSATSGRRRPALSAAEKLEHLAAYDEMRRAGLGAAYLGREGLHPRMLEQWRRQRDAGLLAYGASGAAQRQRSA